MFYKTGQV